MPQPSGFGAVVTVALFAGACLSAPQVAANLYAYVNADGDYVVTRNRPSGIAEYAVLTDDGEFLREVITGNAVPITHWRPWFIPKEPHPFDGPDELFVEPKEPDIQIEEVDPDEGA